MTSPLGPGAAVLAFDVGGTDIKSALVDDDGRVLSLTRSATPRSSADPARAVVTRVGELAAELVAAHPEVRVRAAAVAVPGLVDEQRGIAGFSSNLGWRDADFGALLAEAVPVPVRLVHDVRCATRAEFELGAARGLRDVVSLTIGTGIAGGTIADGRLITAQGYAGEYGHALADPSGEPCACGAVGCLETIASAGAIARRYGARSGVSVPGAREVLQAAKSGDEIARVVWAEAVDALAVQIAQLAAVLAPEAVVIGGGLAEAGSALFEPLEARLRELLSFHRRPRLLPAQLGENAGLLGVALAARDLASLDSADAGTADAHHSQEHR